MDPMTRLFIQLAQWLRNPPSRRQAIVMLVALVAAVSLVLVERFVGWPDWMRSEPVPIRRV